MKPGAQPEGKGAPEAGQGDAPGPPVSEIPGLKLAAHWGAKSLEAFKNVGRRIFEHLVFVAVAIAAAFASDSFLAGICVYIGAVCLIARGMAASPGWLIPAAMGALQSALLALSGLPVPQALFWGGAQAWLQRLMQKRLRMGTEWAMLLFILPVGIHLLDQTPLPRLFGSFACIALIGGACCRIVFLKQAHAPAARDDAASVPDPPEAERIVIYRASLAEFNRKAGRLPESIRPAAESIALSTSGILNSMAADLRDLEPGHRFLHRYFKAAHAVVDKHAGLARENVMTPGIMEALSRSEEMLRRLAEVFAREQARLLENDVSDFSADLAVIDTLLKMDGR